MKILSHAKPLSHPGCSAIFHRSSPVKISRFVPSKKAYFVRAIADLSFQSSRRQSASCPSSCMKNLINVPGSFQRAENSRAVSSTRIGFFCSFIRLSHFVFDDFAEIERLYLIELDFFMQNFSSEIFCEIVCFLLISGDEGDWVHDYISMYLIFIIVNTIETQTQHDFCKNSSSRRRRPWASSWYE